MTDDRLKKCAHLTQDGKQAMGSLGGTHFCAPCLSERIEEHLHTSPPSAIPHRIDFKRCGHRGDGEVCRVCLSATVGCLMLSWSWLKLRNKTNEANRLGSTIRALIWHNGGTHFLT